jgi:hypothetical protein
MSPTALQRMVVRMMFDPILVARLYDGKAVDGVDEEDCALLTKPDRRAWGTDPYRRSRALTGLIAEFPASCAQAGLDALDAFFSSSVFHVCISERGSLTEAFARWVAQRAGPVARIEQAMAQVRRPIPLAGEGVVLSPKVAVITVSGGTLDQYRAIQDQLGSDPVGRIANRETQPVPRPTRHGKEHLLIQASPAGKVTVSTASPGLTKLLEAAMLPCPRGRLLAIARDLGASTRQAEAVVSELESDGLLTEAVAAGTSG